MEPYDTCSVRWTAFTTRRSQSSAWGEAVPNSSSRWSDELNGTYVHCPDIGPDVVRCKNAGAGLWLHSHPLCNGLHEGGKTKLRSTIANKLEEFDTPQKKTRKWQPGVMEKFPLQSDANSLTIRVISYCNEGSTLHSRVSPTTIDPICNYRQGLSILWFVPWEYEMVVQRVLCFVVTNLPIT